MTKDSLKELAKQFVTKHDIKAGWSQEQHVGFVFSTIRDEIGVEGKEEQDALLQILAMTCNPSAFRQTLESASILAKSEKGERTTILANKYV